jgi:hypothetical protein
MRSVNSHCLLGNNVPAGCVPLQWIDKVMEEVGEKVRRMLSEEALRDKNVKETGEETMMEGLKKKHPW